MIHGIKEFSNWHKCNDKFEMFRRAENLKFLLDELSKDISHKDAASANWNVRFKKEHEDLKIVKDALNNIKDGFDKYVKNYGQDTTTRVHNNYVHMLLHETSGSFTLRITFGHRLVVMISVKKEWCFIDCVESKVIDRFGSFQKDLNIPIYSKVEYFDFFINIARRVSDRKRKVNEIFWEKDLSGYDVRKYFQKKEEVQRKINLYTNIFSLKVPKTATFLDALKYALALKNSYENGEFNV